MKQHRTTRENVLIQRAIAFTAALVLLASHSLVVEANKPLKQSKQTTAAAAVFPLSISANKRYLVDAAGKPFMINADSPWSLGSHLTLSQVEQYLDSRKANGFNTVLVNILDDSYKQLLDGTRPFANTSDFSTRNAAYFDYFEQVFQRAKDRGFLVLAVPLYLGCPGGCPGWVYELRENSMSNIRNYGRFIGTRYASFKNIIWVMGGDRNPEEDYARVNELALGVKDTSNLLMTAHTWQPWSAMDQYGSASWLDVNNNYSYHWNGPHIYKMSIDDYLRTPTKPYFLFESSYEHEWGSTPVWIRRQMWWSVTTGSFGHQMGNRPVWFMGDGWQNELNSPGTIAVKHLAAFFENRRWYELVPDGLPDPTNASNHRVVVSGYGTYCTASPANECGVDYISSSRTTDGSMIVAYVPSTGTGTRAFNVNMSQLSGVSTARWYNPTTGDYTTIGTFANSGTRSFVTPGNNGSSANDWVLVIEVGGTLPPTNTPLPPTNTPVNTPTKTPTPQPTNTPVPLPTNTPTPTPTKTATLQPTNTSVPLPTNTPTNVPTITPIPSTTNTPLPGVTPSVTPIPPTQTHTPTPQPTNTPVPLPPTQTQPPPANTPTPRPTNTPVPLPPTATSIFPTNTPPPNSARIGIKIEHVDQSPLAGWSVTAEDLINNSNSTATSDANGTVSFTLTPSSYKICQTLQAGWQNVSPGNSCYWITLAAGNNGDFVFSNQRLTAPTSTPTQPPNGGSNMLLNGDFENGDLYGWESLNSVEVARDSAFLSNYGVSNLNFANMLQKLQTKIGKTYYVSARFRLDQEVVKPSWGGMRLTVVNDDWKILGESERFNGSNTQLGVWQTIKFSFVANTTRSIINYQRFSNGEFNASIDNIVVSEFQTDSPTPTPAPTIDLTRLTRKTYLPVIRKPSMSLP
jgi:hypothetical protein